MNREQAKWELGELIDHAREEIKKIDDGRYDDNGDLSFQVGLEHLMDHLVWAWHFSRKTDVEVDGLIPQLGKIACAIPKFREEYRLVDPSEEPV